MRFNSLFEILEHYSALIPNAPALRYKDRTWTFSALKKEVSALSEHYRRCGKTCLAMLCDGSAECVIRILAANHAGLQVVMLDETLPEDLLVQLVRYTDADALWTSDEELEEILSQALEKNSRPDPERNASAQEIESITECSSQKLAGTIDCSDQQADSTTDCSSLQTDNTTGCSARQPENTTEHFDRILFFTSGTASRSKAVVLTGRSLCSSAWNGSQMLPLSQDDTLLCCLPLAHVFGFVCGLLWGLSCGACVALGRGARHYTDDFGFYKPTAVSLVPSLLAFLLKTKALGPELQNILIGAGDCPPQLIDAVRAAGIAVSFGYGLTETSSGVAISVERKVSGADERAHSKNADASNREGTASASFDPFAMDICPDDTITIAPDGEVLIHAPTCIMQGYYRDDASTAEVLRDGILYSGDLGYIDENGRLHITGRKKDMLVLPDGTKIFLPEYEADLEKVFKEADTAASFKETEFAVDLNAGRPVLIWCGEGTREEIIEKIRPAMEKLPRGQQITDIIFIEGPLPRTATGKLKRWEIRQKANLK